MKKQNENGKRVQALKWRSLRLERNGNDEYEGSIRLSTTLTFVVKKNDYGQWQARCREFPDMPVTSYCCTYWEALDSLLYRIIESMTVDLAALKSSAVSFSGVTINGRLIC